MELKRYIQIVFSWWWLVLICFLVVLVAGFAFSFSQQPQYRSSVTLVVSPKTSLSDLTAVRQSLDTLDNTSIINTYAEIAKSRSIYDQALKNLGLPAETDALQDIGISVSVIQNTNMIRIDAEGSNPQRVFAVANAVTEQSITYVNNLYELYEIKVLDAAALPVQPFSPNVPRDTLLAAALGLIFGVSVSFLAEYLKKPLEALEGLSIVDQETGLYNKRYFFQRVREEISRAKRHQRTLAVCLIRLVNIDNTEQMYTKQTQRMIHRRVAAYLKRHIRTDEVLASWSSNHLAWLLFDTDEEAVRQAIKRLEDVLEPKVFEDEEYGAKFCYTAIFGAAIYTGNLTETELVAQSEQALREAGLSDIGNVYIIEGNGSSSAPALVPVKEDRRVS